MNDYDIEIDVIKKVFENKTDLIIFDIGAYDFYHSKLFKNNFANAEVYAFEADKTNINKYASLNNHPLINIIPLAVSDTDGIIKFYPSTSIFGQEYQGSGSIFKPITKKNSTEGLYHQTLHFDLEGYNVESIRLDTFCKKNNITHIDFIHMDVQSAEMKVMKSLGDIRPIFIFAETCEFATYDSKINIDDFNKYMDSIGYDVVKQFAYDTLYKLRSYEFDINNFDWL